MKRTLLTVLSIVLLAQPMYAAGQPQDMVQEFFNTYRANPEKAVNYIFSTNPWISERNKDGIASLQLKLDTVVNEVGEYYDYELISRKTVGNNMVLFEYMVRYDRQPLLFTFIFYKADNTWKLHNFEFDTSIEEKFEESDR